MEITGIVKENLEGFLSVITEDIVMTENIVAGAIEDNRAVGAVAFSVMKETASLVLDYIYVDPDFRRKGVGSALIKEVVERANPIGVHVAFRNDDELIPFFEKNGFMLAEDAGIYEVKITDMRSSDATNRLLGGKHTEKYVKVLDLLELQKKALDIELLKADIDLSVSEADINKNISFVSLEPGTDNPKSCILCSIMEDSIMVKLLFSATGDYSTLGGLFKEFYKAIEAEDLIDKKLVFTTDEDSIVTLITKMSNGKAKKTGAMIFGFKEFD